MYIMLTMGDVPSENKFIRWDTTFLKLNSHKKPMPTPCCHENEFHKPSRQLFAWFGLFIEQMLDEAFWTIPSTVLT